MSVKEEILAMLREEFERWEALLAELDEAQVTAAQEGHSGGLSIKDEIAHLWAWQQITNARLGAALAGEEPRFPGWLQGLEPDAHENLETINGRIYDMNRDKSWADVYGDWREGYLQVMQQADAVPEADLLEKGRYAWLAKHALLAVLDGTYEHHREEHLEPLLERLGWDDA